MSYPAPILNLNFANAKQLVHPALTFSRASLGSYFDGSGILRYANNSVPRFDHDPLNGICKGLLVEKQRTNYVLQSSDISNATYWAHYYSPVIVGGQSDMFGGTTACSVAKPSASDVIIRQPITISADTLAVCACYYIKKASGCQYRLAMVDTDVYTEHGVHYDAATSSIIYATANLTSYRVSDGPAGYKKVEFALNNIGKSCWAVDILPLTQNAPDIFGAVQVERGASSTSYLPTTTAGVTRAADICSVDLTKLTRNGSPLWNGTEGTIVVDAVVPYIKYSDIFSLTDGTGNNRISAYMQSNGAPAIDVVSSGTDQACLRPLGTTSSGINIRMAAAFSPNYFSSAVNGTYSSSRNDYSGTVPAVTTLKIGRDWSGTSFLSGTIRSIQLYNRRIADSYLPALSAL